MWFYAVSVSNCLAVIYYCTILTLQTFPFSPVFNYKMCSERKSIGIWYSVKFVTAVLRLYLGHGSLVW
jgi:hypothetical protein